jgi:hypothetical protein
VHYKAQTYDEFIFKIQGKPIGQIVYEAKSHEEAQKKEEEQATAKASIPTKSMHYGSVEEEKAVVDKKRIKKDKVHKKKNDVA